MKNIVLIEELEKELKKLSGEFNEDNFKLNFLVHPYTCEITGEVVDKPCCKCDLNLDCKYKK